MNAVLYWIFLRIVALLTVINFVSLTLIVLTCVLAIIWQVQVASQRRYACSTYLMFGLLELSKYNLKFSLCLR